MEKSDLDTLKILEDLIRKVIREELDRRQPFPPKVWGIDVPSDGRGTPVESFVYTAGRHD